MHHLCKREDRREAHLLPCRLSLFGILLAGWVVSGFIAAGHPPHIATPHSTAWPVTGLSTAY